MLELTSTMKPRYMAIFGKNVSLIQLPDFQNAWCPLTVACNNGHMNIIRLLIDRGADVNISEKVY